MKKQNIKTLKPRVTVLLPVYNGAIFLKETIQSILKQSFTNFELLIVNDGSTDDTGRIIESFNDSRIRIINLPKNQGTASALNIGLNNSRGEYIARIDADDVSFPNRLEVQVNYLEKHPQIAICGSAVLISQEIPLPFIGRLVKSTFIKYFPLDSDEIRCKLLFRNEIASSSVLMRSNLFHIYNYRYRGQFPYPEDYDLWSRISQKHKLANLPNVLLMLRRHRSNTSHINAEKIRAFDLKIRCHLLRNLGIPMNRSQITIHQQICNPTVKITPDFLYACWEWFNLIENANKTHHLYPKVVLHKALLSQWQLFFDLLL